MPEETKTVRVRMRTGVASGTTAWEIDQEYDVHAETAAAWVRDGVAEAVGGESALEETDPITAPDAAGLIADADTPEADPVRPKIPERKDSTDEVPEGTSGSVNFDASWNKDELEAEAKRRGIEVEGTGSGGRVLKEDLVKALQG